MKRCEAASGTLEAQQAVRTAGLHYVSDSAPGIHRLGKPGGFRYRNADGRPVRDKAILARIRKLVIPPAWIDVWIAPSATAHLQATGRDAAGRKQYRYHPDFASVRDAHKYAHLAEFAAALPAVRKQLKTDLKRPGLPREKVMAAIVTLLEETLIRVGNEDYARQNGSYGLTTLRNRHVKVRGAGLRFLFKGKSSKQWSLSITDKRVARVVQACQDLPGQHLFEYRDESGAVHTVSSSDVNAYLRQVSGQDITAKDFRTWAGTVKAALGFHKMDGPIDKAAVRAVIAMVAQELGNTIAVCRRCYIHPVVIDAVEAGNFPLRLPRRGRAGLASSEAAVLNFLRRAGV